MEENNIAGCIFMLLVKKNIIANKNYYIYHKLCLEKLDKYLSLKIEHTIYNDMTIFIGNTNNNRIINKDNIIISCCGNIKCETIYKEYIKHKYSNLDNIFLSLKNTYSFVLIDYNTNIIIGCDKSGINKLYYSVNDETFLLADEIKKCGNINNCYTVPNDGYIYNITKENVFIKKINQIQPNLSLEYNNTQIQIQNYITDYTYINNISINLFKIINDKINNIELNEGTIILLTGEFTDNIVCNILRNKYGKSFLIKTCSIAEDESDEHNNILSIANYYNTHHINIDYNDYNNDINYDNLIQKIIYYCETYDKNEINILQAFTFLEDYLLENRIYNIIINKIDYNVKILHIINKYMLYIRINTFFTFANHEIQTELGKIHPQILHNNINYSFIRNMYIYDNTINKENLLKNYSYNISKAFINKFIHFANMKYTMREYIECINEYSNPPNTIEELLYREIFELYFNS